MLSLLGIFGAAAILVGVATVWAALTEPAPPRVSRCDCPMFVAQLPWKGTPSTEDLIRHASSRIYAAVTELSSDEVSALVDAGDRGVIVYVRPHVGWPLHNR